MKKTILIITLSIFTLAIMISSCQTSAEKVQSAKEKVLEAEDNLDKARIDSITEYQQFKMDYEEKIAAHELIIADFKARIANEKKENKASYEKALAELEQKNTDMKKTLAEYKAEGKNNWEFFKTEFSRDLNKLGDAVNELVKKI